MNKRTVELLAPAGSFDSLRAAINAGANSVYFGVEQLNMRAKSVSSFCIVDIKSIAAICKENGIKSYITLNTIMYDHDMQLLQRILEEVKINGVDAVIASDLAVIEACNQLNIPLHISTQANVSNLASVRFYARFADVVVLARELTLKQVEHICKEIKRKNITGISGNLMRIEVFIHGALCMAVSGKCYLSLHTQNSSANRGSCNQVCRRAYKLTDPETNESLLLENEYVMSPRDLCTIDMLNRLVDSGVSVLKIEGRSKGAEYVDTVTRCYREALDAIDNNAYTAPKIEQWIKRLSAVYNRGFWEGYYLGHRLGKWTTQPGSIATEKKVYIGKGSRYYPKIKVGEFAIETGSVRTGDLLMITGPVVGMTKEKMDILIVNGVKNSIAVKGDKITIPVSAKITTSDRLYKIVANTHD